jgi:uncharacterized membrane protein
MTKMIGSWDDWAWLGQFRIIAIILLYALIITISLWLVRHGLNWLDGPRRQRSPNLDDIERQYARGEIDRDAYWKKRQDSQS